jgi:alpha-L-fucosidase 2
MYKYIFLLVSIVFSIDILQAQPIPAYNLSYSGLPERWDEALPLGNATLGALIYQKNQKLRMALDNVYLWDDRNMPEIDKLTFDWVVEQVNKKDYAKVQKIGDEPYEANAAPTKIPAAALEFNTVNFGKVVSSTLDIQSAKAWVKWENGASLETCVFATQNIGYFEFSNITALPEIEIIAPKYQNLQSSTKDNSVDGSGLEKLGYPQGKIIKKENYIEYHQPCHANTWYKVIVRFVKSGNTIKGVWTVKWYNDTQKMPGPDKVQKHMIDHLQWWKKYWSKSTISIPDHLIARQYYLEMYKFGCVARSHTPPISLQAVWTADNGKLPPWKGDFHHDLNTQLSYWPGYPANHADLTAGFTNWLWAVKEVNKRWTKKYFNQDGLNVPGVTTISGKEMGGWIQYSMSPTTVAWLSQHFYWQYKYTLDRKFLTTRCYPYFGEAEKYLSAILTSGADGTLRLPLSSSPEIHDNSIKAWFKNFTNYDLALIKGFYQNCVEIYKETKDTRLPYIQTILAKLPDHAINPTGLMVAPDEELTESHRHMSNYMAIFPIQLLDVHNSGHKRIMDNSLRHLEKLGSNYWVGYSFSWMAILYAKAGQADKCHTMLKNFATNFTSSNSFHVNGDQKGGEFSKFTYRPFTLEGNFAFARAVQEMLLQTNHEVVEIFPAIPVSWPDVSFANLRIPHACSVSATKENGVVQSVTFVPDNDVELCIRLPFKTYIVKGIDTQNITTKDDITCVKMKKGTKVIFENGFE